MALLDILFRTATFLINALIDVSLGRRHGRYVTSLAVKAPIDLVWDAVSAHAITFEGLPRIEVATALRPDTSDIYEGTVDYAGRVVAMAFREVSREPPKSIVIELLQEGSDPAARHGEDHYVACTLTERPDGTWLTTANELTHTNFKGRVLVPLGALLNARRLRRHCEILAGTSRETAASRLGSAVMTGLLTYASFAYLFDWRFAAILVVLLLVHEAGHALAMRWVGMPVQGIYLIPFFGGVAVASAPHRTEGERGFVALMGPGFSLLTTAGFLIAAWMTDAILFKELALVSAILNGINLAPVLPLDGGHVVDAAMSRGDPEIATMLNVLTLIAGVGVAVYLEWYASIVLLALTAPSLLRKRSPRRADPISSAGRNWLLAGYMATLAFYAATVSHLMA